MVKNACNFCFCVVLLPCKVKLLYKKAMKLEDNLYLSKLYDAYGVLLTDSQREILADNLFADLTGSEIAENKGVSRQAVKDAVDKGKAKLIELEEKLHFVEKLEKLEAEIEALKRRR